MQDSAATRKNRLKKRLLDEKRRLWANLRDDLFRKLGKEYNAQFDNPHDIEDLALMDTIEDTGLAIAEVRRKEIEQLDSAMKSLDDGKYGVCVVCGEDIPDERLKAMPYADECVKCATKPV